MRVDAGHPVREFVKVCLANDHAALPAKTSHHRSVIGRKRVREDDAARGRHHSGHVHQVLDGDDRPALLLGREGDEGVQALLLLDAFSGLRQLHAANSASHSSYPPSRWPLARREPWGGGKSTSWPPNSA